MAFASIFVKKESFLVLARNPERVDQEKQAQMERRRKAAAFIGMLKQSNSSGHSSSSR